MKLEIFLAKFHRMLIFLWVFALVLALIPLTANPVKPVKELISAIVVLVLSISLLLWPVRKGTPYDWPRLPTLALCFVWMLWSVISLVIVSDFKLSGLDELRVFWTWMLMGLFAARVFREPKHVNHLFLVVCCAVFISSIYGFVQYFGLDPFPWSTREVEEYRGLPSTYANPNFAGHTLILAMILGGSLAFNKQLRWIVFPMLLLMAAHLYQTHMRAAPLALAVGIIMLLCTWVINRKTSAGPQVKLWLTLIGVLIVGLAGLAVLLPLSKVRTGFYVPTDGSLILRYNGYYGAANMALDHPILGVGPGNYSRVAIAYWTPYEKRWFADQQKRNMRAHCDLLETAVETGFPGLFLHIALLVMVFSRSLFFAFHNKEPDKRRIGYALAAFFLAFAIDGLFGFNLRVPVSGGLFFLMAGIVDGLWSPPRHTTIPIGIAKREKNGAQDAQGKTTEQGEPRVILSLAACGCAIICCLFASLVFVAEIYYQQGNSARLFAENTKNTQHQEEAYRQGIAALLRGKRFAFWDERYADSLAHIAIRTGDMEGAITFYTEALAGDPYNPHKASNLARAYLGKALKIARSEQSSDYAQVEQLLNVAQLLGVQAVQYCAPSLYVQDARWRIARAQAILAEEQKKDATPLWRDVVHHIQTTLEYGTYDVVGLYSALSTAYLRINEPENAIQALQYTLSKKCDDDIAWAIFEKAANDSHSPEPFLDLSQKCFAELTKQLPEKEDAWVNMARRILFCYALMLEDLPVATRQSYAMLDIAPGNPELWSLFAGLLVQQNRPNIFCRSAESFVKSTEDLERIPAFVKSYCSESGDGTGYGEASRELARLATLHMGRPPAKSFAWAADLMALGLENRTLPIQRQAEIRANLATAYLEAERYEDANTNFLFAIENLPENARGRLGAARARALAGLGNKEEALTLIQELVKFAPDDPLVQLIYARILRDVGRTEEATFAYKAALSTLPEKSTLKLHAQHELNNLLKQKRQDNNQENFSDSPGVINF